MVEARAEHEAAQKSRAEDYEHQRNRNRLIRELRADDWTQQAIADAVGCSEGTVRLALKKV